MPQFPSPDQTCWDACYVSGHHFFLQMPPYPEKPLKISGPRGPRLAHLPVVWELWALFNLISGLVNAL